MGPGRSRGCAGRRCCGRRPRWGWPRWPAPRPAAWSTTPPPGGLGPVARTYGLASDRVRAFEVVTGEGVLRRVAPDGQPDLFWALRGGLGALGVVTAVELELLAVDTVYAGCLVFAPVDAVRVLAAWREWCAGLPVQATTSVALLEALPVEALDALLPLAGRRRRWSRSASSEAPSRGSRSGAGALLEVVGPWSSDRGFTGLTAGGPVDPPSRVYDPGTLRRLAELAAHHDPHRIIAAARPLPRPGRR